MQNPAAMNRFVESSLCNPAMYTKLSFQMAMMIIIIIIMMMMSFFHGNISRKKLSQSLFSAGTIIERSRHCLGVGFEPAWNLFSGFVK